MPVFFVSWGSGQNVLLSYLIIPFIKIFDLTMLTVRLPMAILGCISLIVIYFLLRKISNEKIALIGLTFFAICPWHIMKSRWGLESNLFPDIILLFTFLLIKALEDKNSFLYYLAFVVAGISAYAYGTAYYFLPAFLIPLLFILVKNKKITLKKALISLLIVIIVTSPIIIYVIINTFNLPQINLPIMTIPRLEVNRYKVLTSIFSSSFIKNSIDNFLKGYKILIFQYDGLPWNSIKGIGTIYLFSIVFTILGACEAFSRKKILDVKYTYLFNIWFVVAILLMFICEPNINRINIIMFPIIYYTILGIGLCIKKYKILLVPIVILYLIALICFIYKYSKQDYRNYFTFTSGLGEVIEYANNISKDDEIVFLNSSKTKDYIYVLYYTEYNTQDFIDTVEYKDKCVEFREVNSFGKYKFKDENEDKDITENDKIYIIKKQDVNNYNLTNCEIKNFDNYVVVTK